MKINQGDVIEVNILLPDGSFKPHPCLVLSNNDINHYEGVFIGVMFSSIPTQDDYTFNLTSNMFVKPLKKKTQVRLQLTGMHVYKEITKYNLSKIKQKYLEQIIDNIFIKVLSTE